MSFHTLRKRLPPPGARLPESGYVNFFIDITGTMLCFQDEAGVVTCFEPFSSEAVQDIVGSLIQSGGVIVPVYNDTGNSLTLTIAANAVTNAMLAVGIDAAKIANGSVSNTEFQYLNGVIAPVQDQLDSKTTFERYLGTTTSATPVALAALTFSGSEMIMLELKAVCRKTTGATIEGAAFVRRALVSVDSGVPTLLDVATEYSARSQNPKTWNLKLNAVGSTLEILAVGDSGDSLTWRVDITYTRT